MESFWLDCLNRFKRDLPPQQFNTWIKPLRLETNDTQVRILAPNRFVMQWVKDKFLSRIEEMAEVHFSRPVSFLMALQEPGSEKNAPEPAANAPAPAASKKRA